MRVDNTKEDLKRFPKFKHSGTAIHRYTIESVWSTAEEAKARVQVLKDEGWLAFGHRYNPSQVGVYRRKKEAA